MRLLVSPGQSELSQAQVSYYARRLPEAVWNELRQIANGRLIGASYTWRGHVIAELIHLGIAADKVTPEIIRAIAKTVTP